MSPLPRQSPNTAGNSPPASRFDAETAPAGVSAAQQLPDSTEAGQRAARDDSSASVPSWFARKRARAGSSDAGESRERKAGTKRPLAGATKQPERISWYRRFTRWFRSYDAFGYEFSFLVHVLILLLASLVFVKGVVEGDQPGVSAQMADEELRLFDDPIDTRLQQQNSDIDPAELPQLQEIQTATPELPAVVLPSDLISSMAVTGSGGEGSKQSSPGLAFKMPEGGSAITKGSFTVWTVPKDPAPYQDYLIVIQVKLLHKMHTYPRNDLSGRVVGTDRYEQELPGFGLPMGAFLPVKNQATQLAVPVPGAERLVKDTITVRSNMLKEKQTIEIVF